MSDKERESRIPINDEAGVSLYTKPQEQALYAALSEATVGDLICEGGIDGIVSGEYSFIGNAGDIGYERATFRPYTALDHEGTCREDLGFLRSIYWNEVPVVDKDGYYNFQEINIETKLGSPQGETPTLNPNLPLSLDGKRSSSFELTLFRSIGERVFGPSIDLREAKIPRYYLYENNPHPPHLIGDIDKNAKVYMVNNKEAVAVRVNFRIPQLWETLQDDPNDAQGDGGRKGFKGKVFKGGEDAGKAGFHDQEKGATPRSYGSGDIKARKIKFHIYVRPVFDTRHTEDNLFYPWSQEPVKRVEVFGRIQQPYIRSEQITFNKSIWGNAFSTSNTRNYKYFQGWEIKIVRLTPDSFNQFLKNESYIDSLVEVYDSRLRYPYASMVYSKFSAEFFQRIPHRSYDTKLLKVKIPNTYNPTLRHYDESELGYWDGCFKAEKEWTNNPAWCFYDLITNNRYGLGDYIDRKYVDKWTLYEIAKYCDTLVSDGKGGLEPRFTLNHLITSREEAYKVVNDMASAFRSIVYYAFGNIYVSQDKPKDPIYLFTTSNVADGTFNYSSSAKKARHTVAIVRYSDKHNLFKPAIAYAEDQVGIQRYGIREVETSAVGCTSEGQAKRFGEWILKSEILETESVTFTAGIEGMYIRPGDVISVYDEFRHDRKLAGRTLRVEEEGSGIIPVSDSFSFACPRTDVDGNYPITGNVITIDKPLYFSPDREYKMELLTPTNYFEPTQITPTNCEETGGTRTVEGGTTKGGYKELNPTEMNLEYEGSDNIRHILDSSSLDASIFKTEETVAVTSSKGEFIFHIWNSKFETTGLGFPKRYILKVDGEEIFDSGYIGNKKTNYGKDHTLNGPANEGDLFGCLKEYEKNGGTDAIKALATAELAYLQSNPIKETVTPIRKDLFIKDAEITSITIEVIHPITAYITRPQALTGDRFRIGLERISTWVSATTTEPYTVEDLKVNATNSDKALTSADFPEIRKNQIQTVLFSGYQAVATTGDYHSDFSVNGSGIVTKIYLDNQFEAGFNFTDYAITGYDNSSVIGDLAAGVTDTYSQSYENPSGRNLVWAIEPSCSDSTENRPYTLDSEVASGQALEYKVINITENDSNKYDIMAIESVSAKFCESSEDCLECVETEDPCPDPPCNGDGGGGPELPRVPPPTITPPIEKPKPKPKDPDPKPPEEDPDAVGACCQDEGHSQRTIEKTAVGQDTFAEGTATIVYKPCTDNVLKKDCPPSEGVWFPEETCAQIQERGECQYLVPPDPPEPPKGEYRPIELEFKVAIDVSSLSPAPGTMGISEDKNYSSHFRLKTVTDMDVWGDEIKDSKKLQCKAMREWYKDLDQRADHNDGSRLYNQDCDPQKFERGRCADYPATATTTPCCTDGNTDCGDPADINHDNSGWPYSACAGPECWCYNDEDCPGIGETEDGHDVDKGCCNCNCADCDCGYAAKVFYYGDTFLDVNTFYVGHGVDRAGETVEGTSGPGSQIVNDYCKWQLHFEENDTKHTGLIPVHFGMNIEWPDDKGSSDRGTTGSDLKRMLWDEEPGHLIHRNCNKPIKGTAIFQYQDQSNSTYGYSGPLGSTSQSPANLIENGKCYWIAPPNQDYRFSVTQKLTRYPGFLRDGDGQLLINPTTNSIWNDEEKTELFSDYPSEDWYDQLSVNGGILTDVRDHCFETINESNGGIFKNSAIKPYTASCEKDDDCVEYDSRAADVNPAYQVGINIDKIAPDQQIIEFNYATEARLNVCGINNIDVLTFKARPLIWVSHEMTEDNLLDQIHDMDHENLMNLLAPGQFLFYTCHLQRQDSQLCSHQASYAYTFGICLNDQNIILKEGEDSTKLTDCVFAPNFSPHSAKIYATPVASLAGGELPALGNDDTLFYPGSVLVNDTDKPNDGDPYCMYLGGRIGYNSIVKTNGYPNSVSESHMVGSAEWALDPYVSPNQTFDANGLDSSANGFSPSEAFAGGYNTTLVVGIAEQPFEDGSIINPINRKEDCGGTVKKGLTYNSTNENLFVGNHETEIKTEENPGHLHTKNSVTTNPSLFGGKLD